MRIESSKLVMAEILKQLAALRKMVEELKPAAAAPKAQAFTVPAAAKEIGIGLTKMRDLVKHGAVQTVPVGKREMVPQVEIDRVLSARRKLRGTPTQERRQEAFAKVPVSPKVHAAQLKAKQRPTAAVSKTSVRASIDAMLNAKKQR